MNPEQRYFIRLLRDYVRSSPSTEPEEALDWPLLVRYAERQDLSGILYYQCRGLKSVDADALQTLHAEFLSVAYRAVNFDAAMDAVGAAFSAAGIDYMPFKGELLRLCYPHPELRTMGDRDILIHPSDREASDRIMRALGYDGFIDHPAVWVYQKPALTFELHDSMFYEHLANQVDYRAFFETVWDGAADLGAHRFAPKPELHFLYLMAHAAKHIVNYGTGFRPFLDMVFFCRAESPLDWDYIVDKLRELSLYEFTLRCFRLCEEWFDVTMPLPCGTADDAFLTDTTEKIFRDGLFGYGNTDDNAGARAAKEILHDGKPYALAAARQTVHNLFPPYRDLESVPWYSWVSGKPWLLPAAWVYRWFFVLLHKGGRGKKRLQEAFQRDSIQKRRSYLDSWGL